MMIERLIIYAIVVAAVLLAVLIGWSLSRVMPWYFGITLGAVGLIVSLGNLVLDLIEEEEDHEDRDC